ncbi:MAG: hypothetical protein ABW321_14540 [Polyangiales bacterium]
MPLKLYDARGSHDHLKELDAQPQGREWPTDQLTIADPYALVFYWCGIRQQLPVLELTAFPAHTQAPASPGDCAYARGRHGGRPRVANAALGSCWLRSAQTRAFMSPAV